MENQTDTQETAAKFEQINGKAPRCDGEYDPR